MEMQSSFIHSFVPQMFFEFYSKPDMYISLQDYTA